MREDLKLREELDGHVYWIQGVTAGERPLHSHTELELNLVVSGNAEYLIDGARVRLESGSLLWLFPAQTHALATSSEDFEMWVYVFRPRLLEDACRTERFRSLAGSDVGDLVSVQLFPRAFSQLSELCESASQALEENADFFNASVRYLLLTAWQLTLERGSGKLESRALHPGVFRAAMELVNEPGLESLSELARKVGMSSEHLSRLFKQQMGQSLSEYRSEQRFRKFRELYSEGGSLNMLEASLAAGFGSYAQFYRIHLKRTGRAPSADRRSKIALQK